MSEGWAWLQTILGALNVMVSVVSPHPYPYLDVLCFGFGSFWLVSGICSVRSHMSGRRGR
jgi:hypothetical protein